MEIKKKIKNNLLKMLGKILSVNNVLLRSYLRVSKKKIFSNKGTTEEVDIIYKYFQSLNVKTGLLMDAGAHTGSFFERFLWNGWEIHAFEPDPSAKKVNCLEKFSEHKNVNFSNKACSDKSGLKLKFYNSEESTGISSLHVFHKTHQKIGEVETITLADYVNDMNIDKVNLLKIDTEGHDLFVLKGFPWDTIKPGVVFCEFEDSKTVPLGYSYKDLGDFLTGKGYSVYLSEWYPVVKYGGNHRWRMIKKYPCELEDEKATGNLFCFHEKLSEEFELFLLNVQIVE